MMDLRLMEPFRVEGDRLLSMVLFMWMVLVLSLTLPVLAENLALSRWAAPVLAEDLELPLPLPVVVPVFVEDLVFSLPLPVFDPVLVEDLVLVEDRSRILVAFLWTHLLVVSSVLALMDVLAAPRLRRAMETDLVEFPCENLTVDLFAVDIAVRAEAG